MKRIFTLAAIAAMVSGTAVLAQSAVESTTTSTPGATSSSSTTIMQTAPAQPNVIVAPESNPSITTTKKKIHRHGLFHNTKVKEESTTVTP